MLDKWFKFLHLVAIVLLVILNSCKSVEIPKFSNENNALKINYLNEDNWAVLPKKYPDFKFWQTDTTQLKADVFYIYPTLNTAKKDLRWNVPLSDKKQQNKVLNVAVKYQASAFSNAGKVYVPFYRQAHIRSYSNLENGGKKALEWAYEDVKNAFEVYLEKYNKNRPIIIAAHSQGTTHAIKLLQEYFDNKPLQKKLIAAYLPGIAIDAQQFKTIKLMTKPNETGGFVSWNTFKKNYYPVKYKSYFKGRAVSNPVSWNTNKTSLRKNHKGFLFRNEKIYSHSLQVTLNDGVLWTTTPKFPYKIFILGKKNYHVGDINLFWEDIKQNAVLRVNTYLENNKN